MEEIEQLRSEVNRRYTELKQRRDQSTMEIRRATQSTLEAALHRLAELEELRRIEDVKRSAVESGLVVSPVDIQRSGKCPLCPDDLTFTTCAPQPKFCCGVMVCIKCENSVRMRQDEALEKIKKANKSSREKEEAQSECLKWYNCFNCGLANGLQDIDISNMKRNAEAGKAWAQLEIGLMTMGGYGGFEKDRFKAAEWFSLAADQGNAMAISMLFLLWGEGFPELGVPSSKVKADKYMIQAAQHGCSLLQTRMARKEGEGSDKSLIWNTLAAAQGDTSAQFALANIHLHGTHGSPKSVFAAIYWFRKAALQGELTSQGCLAYTLLKAKEEIYDGEVDIAGYSAVPEARFWLSLSEKSQKQMHIPPMPRPEALRIVDCGHCGTSLDEGARLLCSACRSIGYCSKSCQGKHWKMGHKRDCASVCMWINKAKDRPSNIHIANLG
jgi:uncharacterized protein